MEKQPMDPEDRRRRVEAVLEELSPYAREHLVQLVSLGDRCSQMFDELGPGQNVDEGKGDPLHYPYHDALFASWVERWDRAAPVDILRWHREGRLAAELGIEEEPVELFSSPAAFVEDLERWWSRFQGLGLAKRIQAPPVLGVKRRAFGFDYREAQLGVFFGRAYRRLKEELLEG